MVRDVDPLVVADAQAAKRHQPANGPLEDLATTQRYMHLSPAALDAAIGLLDEPAPIVKRGDIVETAAPVAANVRR
jgi:hypothetical protein